MIFAQKTSEGFSGKKSDLVSFTSMGRGIDLITFVLLAANVIPSIMAFRDVSILERYKFHMGAIVQRKEYYRLVTGAFLHGSFNHLLFNMLSLYFIGMAMPTFFGELGYLLIYFGAMMGGNALAYLVHRNNPNYAMIGASGAIAGIIFAFVYLAPGSLFYLFFFIPCPAWLFAILFVGVSIFGIRSQAGNIGHEAHLGGGIAGMLLAILLRPEAITTNWWIVLVLLAPTAILIYLILERPDLFAPKPYGRRFQLRDLMRAPGPRVVRDRNDRKYANDREELDALLDKVQKKGYKGLSKKEKLRLDELSGK